jgi:ElaB/YqjD/DUF883 family membrane-anchored ribosome-binding protein
MMADSIEGKSEDYFARNSDEIQADIEARREYISQTVDQLGEKFHETMNWRAYVARHPYLSIGVAMGTGLILSGMFRRKPSPGERIVGTLVETIEDLGDDVRNSVRKMIVRTAAPSLFRGVLYGLAGKMLMQYVQNRSVHAHGNGGHPSHEPGWKDSRNPASMSPNMS